jgi:hypothetical protein
MTTKTITGTLRRARQIQTGWWVHSPSVTIAVGGGATANEPAWREVSYFTHYDEGGRRMRSFTFTDGTSWSTPATSDVLSLNLDESYRAGLRR